MFKLEENRKKEDDLAQVLKLIAPGTELREGLENILRTNTGALIVVGDSQEVLNIVDGGFNMLVGSDRQRIVDGVNHFLVKKPNGFLPKTVSNHFLIYVSLIFLPDFFSNPTID